MTRFMKPTLAAVVLATFAGMVSAQSRPVRVPVGNPLLGLPKAKTVSGNPVQKGLPAQNPQFQNDPSQEWKLGVRISGNPGGGLYIHDVFPNSPAELVGLSSGMVLLTVDGVLYNSPTAARDKIMFQSGDTVDLIYGDSTGFYQVTAELTTITTMMAPVNGGAVVKKVMPKVNNLKRVRVADPRKK